MTNSQRLATVRAHLQRWLAANVTPCSRETCSRETPVDVTSQTSGGGESQELAENRTESQMQPELDLDHEDVATIVSESILIRDGFYAGRTFHAMAQGETFRATWFMEPDELKIHGAGGALVVSFQGDEIDSQHPVLEDQHEDPPSESAPISIPMPAAGQDRQSDQDSDQDCQIPKAA